MCGISWTILSRTEKLGETIRKERDILNGNMKKVLSSFSEECAMELASSREPISDLKEHIQNLERKDDETNEKLDNTNQKLDDILTMLQAQSLSQKNSFSQTSVKRRRVDDEVGRREKRTQISIESGQGQSS